MHERDCYDCDRAKRLEYPDLLDPNSVFWHCYSEECPCGCSKRDPKEVLQEMREVFLAQDKKIFIEAVRKSRGLC